jgi:peptidoglycan/xylan/chitin deacetylase (PgdA/CDA1 family)
MLPTERIHYSGLNGNQDLLQSGLPVFTFHKIARRPWRAKWRSLYLSPRSFARQMSELAHAGYGTARLSDPRPARGNPGRKFVLTFDDGYESVALNAAPVLREHGFTAIQFIVAGEIGGTNAWDVGQGEVEARLMDAGQIRAWLQAGHEIGSHTLSHPRLSQLPPLRLREEIAASKRRLEDLFGVQIRHFCYPYGDYDQRVVEEVARAGYETACTHIRSGVSIAATPSHELRRIEARYPKRNARLILARLWRWRLLARAFS